MNNINIIKHNDYLKDDKFPIATFRLIQEELFLHCHEFTELVIIVDGTGTHFLEEQSFPICAGDVFVINDGAYHGYKDTDKLHIINILFDEEFILKNSEEFVSTSAYHALFHLEPYLRQNSDFSGKLHLSKGNFMEAINIAERIESELESKKLCHKSMTLGFVFQIISELCRYYSNEKESVKINLMNIGKIISLLENDFENDIALNDLSKLSCMSVNSLLRHFKKTTGLSPIQYLLKVRIDKAKYLLLNSKNNISEIAYKTGQKDSNYFTRKFKELTGLTPSEYRKKI